MSINLHYSWGIPQQIHIQCFLDFFYFSFFRYNLFIKKVTTLTSEKIHINLIKYKKFGAILEGGGFKIAPVEKKLKKKILECILYIEVKKSSS